MLDSDGEASIFDTTFSRKLGCNIDESRKRECVYTGKNTDMTEGRTRIKITLNG